VSSSSNHHERDHPGPQPYQPPPVIAYRVTYSQDRRSLHHERPSAERAAVELHGLAITELIELTPHIRTALEDHAIMSQTLDRLTSDPTQHHLSGLEHITLALRIANRCVITDLQSNCQSVQLGDLTWLDTRAMLDEREHCGEVLDLHREAVAYALDAQLVTRHFQQPYLVRLTTAGQRAVA